ncbi:hypothetical protein F5148DRAFT_1145621 [Russula earlei]|uniref:Uncharacterized protein n=1 Tax=Russula earlei TaxID=71964 RepID=A0ACC0UNV8_9AGAM|nr:hypothetical protein F5148DRAFT_1145621 [Russula earlei]
MTSELSKNLYNSNIALEEKHKALLARLPSASSMTPRATPSSSPAPTPDHGPSPLPYHRTSHARRISVSPSDLALLADQNAELLQTLEKLESESAHANLAGRRRLGKLEKEIDMLREELDQHRTQSDALQLQVERRDEEAKRRRREWNDRVRAHRSNKSGSSWAFSSDAEDDLRDFAPRPALPLTGLRPATSDTVSAASLDISPGDAPSLHPASTPPELSPPELSSPSSVVPPPAGESALVAQLVSKVRELEITNEQILESQRDTAVKLHEAQIEAEGIRRLYAFLDERNDVELEVVDDREQEDEPVDDPSSTMRFRSLRRSINGDLRQLSASTVGEGAEADIGSHPNQLATAVEPVMMANDVYSPALSPLVDLPAGSLFSVPRQPSRGPTLGSELGSDYGRDYAENHHLRSSSLYDVFLSGPSHPATPASPPRDIQTSTDPSPEEPQQFQKPMLKATHHQRLSETVRARTHTWAARRFHFTAPIGRLNSLFEPEAENSPNPASKPSVAQVGVQTVPCDEVEQDLPLIKVDDTHELQHSSEASTSKRGRVMKVLIELWLWVQFIIIIMVFLWAVTKRGPRSVFRNASRTVKRVE